MRWIVWGKKLFLCLVVLVLRALWRRSDGNGSNRECAGCEGPEWFYQLFFSLWMSTVLGEWGGLPMIHSSVRTTLRSLLRSDLVAELNQTVIDMQRTDSMMAVYKCFSSSCGRLSFLRWWRKYSLCWAFFTMESMWLSHFSSCEMVVPRSLNDSTAVTVLFMMVSGGGSGGFLLKSMIISTVLSVFSYRLLRLH